MYGYTPQAVKLAYVAGLKNRNALDRVPEEDYDAVVEAAFASWLESGELGEHMQDLTSRAVAEQERWGLTLDLMEGMLKQALDHGWPDEMARAMVISRTMHMH